MKRFISGCLALVFGLTLSAQVRSISLTEALQQGEENNFQIRIADSEYQVAISNDDWALAGKNPSLSLSVNPGIGYTNRNDPASVVRSSNTLSYSVGPAANFNYPIYDGGRSQVVKTQLEGFRQLAFGQLELQRQNSLQAITQAYFTALLQREQLEVRTEVLNLSRDRIEYQEIRAEYGQAGSFEELQARDAFLNDSISLEIQRTSYENAIRQLLQLMGETELDQEITLSDELEADNSIISFEAQRQLLLTDNQSLRNLEVNRNLSRINTEIISTELKPQLSLGAGLSYNINLQTGKQTFDFGNGMPNEVELPGTAARTLNVNAGVTGTYLLMDGGSRKRRIESARLQEVTAQLNYDATQQNLLFLLDNTLALYRNQQEVHQLTQQLVRNAETNLSIAEERLRGALINSFDYRQIQLNFLNAQFQQLNALFNLKITETELEGLTGQL